MIEVFNLSKNIGTGSTRTKILRNISFEVKDSAFVIITGRSGSGKSSLLYQLGLLDSVEIGTIIIDGKDLSHLSSAEQVAYRLANFGFIYQDYGLLSSLTALENTLLPLLMRGEIQSVAVELSMKALRSVHLERKVHSYPQQLSGGEQQRVGIARAIAQAPRLLFADEPTANLDSESSKKIIDIFKKLHSKGQTIIMVTHEQDFLPYATQILVLSDGKVVENKLNTSAEKKK